MKEFDEIKIYKTPEEISYWVNFGHFPENKVEIIKSKKFTNHYVPSDTIVPSDKSEKIIKSDSTNNIVSSDNTDDTYGYSDNNK